MILLAVAFWITGVVDTVINTHTIAATPTLSQKDDRSIAALTNLPSTSATFSSVDILILYSLNYVKFGLLYFEILDGLIFCLKFSHNFAV